MIPKDTLKGTMCPYRVAQVWALPPGKQPETLTELTISTEDLYENAHTRFAMLDDSNDSQASGINNGEVQLKTSIASLLEGSYGLRYDSYSGCLALCASRVLSSQPATPVRQDSSNRKEHTTSQTIHVFASLWHWRSNTLGFTAVSKSTLNSYKRNFPISQFFLTRERQAHKRRAVHLHSLFGRHGGDRLRKDVYETGVLSPPLSTRRVSSLGGMQTCPLLMTSTSIAFPRASQVRLMCFVLSPRP